MSAADQHTMLKLGEKVGLLGSGVGKGEEGGSVLGRWGAAKVKFRVNFIFRHYQLLLIP